MVLLYGVDSNGYNIHKLGKAITDYLNVEYLQFSGGHIGFHFEPERFSAGFVELCKNTLFCRTNKIANLYKFF